MTFCLLVGQMCEKGTFLQIQSHIMCDCGVVILNYYRGNLN